MYMYESGEQNISSDGAVLTPVYLPMFASRYFFWLGGGEVIATWVAKF